MEQWCPAGERNRAEPSVRCEAGGGVWRALTPRTGSRTCSHTRIDDPHDEAIVSFTSARQSRDMKLSERADTHSRKGIAVSWDVFVQDLPPGIDSIADIPDDFRPASLGPREAIVAGILTVVPDADFADPTWGRIEGPDEQAGIGFHSLSRNRGLDPSRLWFCPSRATRAADRRRVVGGLRRRSPLGGDRRG